MPTLKNIKKFSISVIHSGDEFTDLSEAPCATKNEGTQAPYGISQHRTIVEEEGRRMGGSGDLPPETFFRATPSRTSENALLEHGMKDAITIHICSQRENYSFYLKTKCKKVMITLLLPSYSPMLETRSHARICTEIHMWQDIIALQRDTIALQIFGILIDVLLS